MSKKQIREIVKEVLTEEIEKVVKKEIEKQKSQYNTDKMDILKLVMEKI
jgi:acyl carrier protein